MDNENVEPQVEEETPAVEETTEETPTPTQETVTLSKSDYTKLNRKAIAYDTVKKNPPITNPEPVDSVDLLKLGKKLQNYSDEEIDAAIQFAGSKKPEDILKAFENPYLKAGIEAQREKVEKERLTLKPSGTQPESEQPLDLEARLTRARTDAEKQAILEEYNLYSEPRRRADPINPRTV